MDFLNPSFWLFVAVIAGIYGIMALGLYVQYSLAGLPNFGHVAFMAVAAYAMAILVVRFGAPLLLAAVGGLVAAVFLAIVMGAPALRLRADYLAIATVAGGEIIRYLALNLRTSPAARSVRSGCSGRVRSRCSTAAGKHFSTGSADQWPR